MRASKDRHGILLNPSILFIHLTDESIVAIFGRDALQHLMNDLLLVLGKELTDLGLRDMPVRAKPDTIRVVDRQDDHFALTVV